MAWQGVLTHEFQIGGAYFLLTSLGCGINAYMIYVSSLDIKICDWNREVGNTKGIILSKPAHFWIAYATPSPKFGRLSFAHFSNILKLICPCLFLMSSHICWAICWIAPVSSWESSSFSIFASLNHSWVSYWIILATVSLPKGSCDPNNDK